MRRFYTKLIVTLLSICFVVSVFFVYTSWEAEQVEFSEKTLSFSNLPSAFDGLRVLQISDLHARFLSDDAFWETLLAKKPDLTVFTGDTFDRHATQEDLERIGELVRRFSEISTVYFVGGNHEAQADLLERAVTVAEEGGAEFLSDCAVTYERDGETVTVMGLKDPKCRENPNFVRKTLRTQTLETLEGLSGEMDGFTLLLAHRPEDVDLYSRFDVELVLSGHTHGGQIRLPLLGAVFAPAQGFFPKYSAGEYRVADTTLYVSRGLGGEHRLLCPPEVTLFTLKTA